MKQDRNRERISPKKTVALLGKALRLSYSVRTKVSIAVSLIGFAMALLPSLISKALQGFTDSMYTLYIDGMPALRQALLLFAVLVALYIGQAVYDSLATYYNRVDTIHIHTFLREQLIRFTCRVQYKYIDNYDNFKERSEVYQDEHRRAAGEQYAADPDGAAEHYHVRQPARDPLAGGWKYCCSAVRHDNPVRDPCLSPEG